MWTRACEARCIGSTPIGRAILMAALWDADSGLRNLMDQFDSDSGCHFKV